MSRLRRYFLTALAAWAVAVMPAQAMAHTLLQCDGTGGVERGTTLFNTDSKTGPHFKGSACQYAGNGLRNIFGQITCNFVSILNDILGKTYCAMQYTLLDIMKILLALYIAVFGVQILMGTAQLNASEIMIRLLKIGGVTMFMTQSIWGIEFVFTFFMDLAAQGIKWALNAMSSVPGGAGSFCNDLTGTMPVYACIDTLIFTVVTGPFTEANSKLVGFFAVMAYVMPPIFGLAVYWLWVTFTILARALISFLLCIAALGFLISLSPIFLSLMLFAATRQFFENWLKFMISFSLQVTVVFMVIAAWAIVSSKFIGFFDDLKTVIFPYQKIWVEAASVVDPVDSWGICPYEVFTDAVTKNLRIKCVKEGFDPVGPIPDCGRPPLLDCSPDVIADKKAIIALSNLAQKKCEYPPGFVGPIPTDCSGISATQTALSALIYYVIYHLITLTIIFYAFDALLRQAPSIAKELAGPTYVPLLGQGFGATGFGRIGGGGGKGGGGAPGGRGPFTPGQFPGGGRDIGGGIGGILDQYGASVGRR